jgi:hypothetical protein
LKIFLYRLSLTAAPPDLFGDPAQKETRYDFLKRLFEAEFTFDQRKGKRLKYQHTQTDGDVLSGAICRWMSESFEGDPTDPFTETDGGRWAKAAFYFNLGNDQQVFGLEYVNAIGNVQSVIKGLVEAMNVRSGGVPYKIDVYAVNTKDSFRRAVASYPGPVTSLTFDLILPNPTDGEGKTKEALKRLKKKAGADRLKATAKSDDGIITTSKMVKDAVGYAESGGGDVVAKDGGHVIYSSKSTVKTENVPEEMRPNGGEIDGLSAVLDGKLQR